MATRELTGSPSVLPTYLRAAATLIPGAGRLPAIPGGGGDMPDLALVLREVAIDPDQLARYRAVCQWPGGDTVPAPFVHVLAFGLHMALMADGRFPFAAIGLVHVENEIEQVRPVTVGDRLTFRVHATTPEPHPRGRTFAIVTTAHCDGELVFSERSTMLRRGSAAAQSPSAGPGGSVPADKPAATRAATKEVARETWRVPDDVGRRYASVSGDRNPIHMHPLTAKAFGFPRAIAHGMWTKARCLGALAGDLPDQYTVAVTFRKPLLLPGEADFQADRRGGVTTFALTDAGGAHVHLTGEVHGAPPKKTTASPSKRPATKPQTAEAKT
jgi:acyl dehydratase